MVVVLPSYAKSKQKHLISSREFPFLGVRLDHMVEISNLSIKFGYEFIHEFKTFNNGYFVCFLQNSERLSGCFVWVSKKYYTMRIFLSI